MPKPGSLISPTSPDDEADDDDIEFDDLATAPDPLKNAIDLELADDPDTDDMIKDLVADDKTSDDDDEDEEDDGPDDDGPSTPPTIRPMGPAGQNPAGSPAASGGSSMGPARSGGTFPVRPGTPPPVGLAAAGAAAPRPPMGGPAPLVSGDTPPPAPRPSTPPPAAAPPSAASKPSTPPAAAAPPPKVESGSSKGDGPVWKLPSLDEMLTQTPAKPVSDEELRQRAVIIEQTLSSFGAPARVVEVNQGPVITQFGVEPDYIEGRGGKRIKVKVGKISALADDLALALAAPSIRIEAPVPGKGFVGIEVPNAEPSVVNLRSALDTPEFRNMEAPLKLALGQDVSGQPVIADLATMPHLLIAGTTGSGNRCA